MKKQNNEEVRVEVQIIDDEEIEEVGSKKRPHFLGPMLKGEEAKHLLDFMCRSHIEPYA